MTTPLKKAYAPGVVSVDAAKHWLMVLVSVALVVIYVAALLGWLRPLADITLVARLEPIIFVLIGFYFGQIPVNQDRKFKRRELERAFGKLEATQEAKELVQRERDALAEKIHNARIALDRVVAAAPGNGTYTNSHTPAFGDRPARPHTTDLSGQSAEIVKKILDS